jgi:hypothetical protein
MMYPESDSAFYAYYDWALEQELAWQEDQWELEQLEQLENNDDDA